MLRIPLVTADEELNDPALPIELQRPPGTHGSAEGTSRHVKVLDMAPGMGEPMTIDSQSVLDFALVKDLMTDLHQEGDAQMEKYAAYSGRAIGEIVAQQRVFIDNVKSKYLGLLKEERQKQLFRKIAAWYFDALLRDAEELQRHKSIEYLSETVERQNAVLLARALRAENVCDDGRTTMYRNMILRNMESLAEYLPEPDHSFYLDKAARSFYLRVLERRLEVRPSSLHPMLAAPTVRRVLGDDLVSEYTERMGEAEQDEQQKEKARQWCEENLTEDEGKQRARLESENEEEERKLLEEFIHRRNDKERARLRSSLERVAMVWKLVVEQKGNIDVLPVGIRRSDGRLVAFILPLLQQWEKRGGIPEEPEYAAVALMAMEWRKNRLMEKLTDEEHMYQFLTRIGGPGSRAYGCLLRILGCESTEDDRRWIDDIVTAKKIWEDATPPKPMGIQEFLSLFNTSRQLKMRKEANHSLDPISVVQMCRDLLNIQNSNIK